MMLPPKLQICPAKAQLMLMMLMAPDLLRTGPADAHDVRAMGP